MAGKDTIVLAFTKERETKNTVVFREEGDTPAVGQLYVQKAAVTASGIGDSITVTIANA